MKKLYEEADIQAIANVLRAGTNSTDTWKVSEMADVMKGFLDIVVQPALPEGYTALSYIAVTGGQKINTGVIPNGHTITVKYNMPAYVHDGHLFGTDAGPSSCHFTTYANRYYWGTGKGEQSAGTYSNGEHEVVYNDKNGNVSLDGVSLGSAGEASSSSELTICARVAANFQGKLYYFIVHEKDTEAAIRKMFPARRDSDGAVGMYDTANDVFYANAGTGSFTAGPNALTD